MEFTKVIKERYSVRKYKPDMIWDDELNRILEAGISTNVLQSSSHILLLKPRSSEQSCLARMYRQMTCTFGLKHYDNQIIEPNTDC